MTRLTGGLTAGGWEADRVTAGSFPGCWQDIGVTDGMLLDKNLGSQVLRLLLFLLGCQVVQQLDVRGRG